MIKIKLTHDQIKNRLGIDMPEGLYNIEIKKQSDKRTKAQNRSLHDWCNSVAIALNDAGYDVRTFFKEGVSIPFTRQIVVDDIWRPVQMALTGHVSTKDPTPKQYIEIYEVLNRALSEKGIHVPWKTHN